MQQPKPNAEPRGFSEHTRKRSGKNAHQHGWGLNEEERRRLPQDKQDWQGGSGYEYGAQDFGDTPVKTTTPHRAQARLTNSCPNRSARKSGS
jgi:hypothetical protein